MAFISHALGYCPVAAEYKVEDGSCFAGELVVVWVSCCLWGHWKQCVQETAKLWEWDVKGISPKAFLPSVGLALLLGGL